MSLLHPSQPPQATLSRTLALALGAVGVVFGDLGTSPIYAIAEALRTPGLPAAHEAVLGIVSLIVWTLLLVVSVKYMLFITSADNEGEGGIFAIVALLRKTAAPHRRRQLALTFIALASFACLFADSLITPPLSVMSALEGLELITPKAGAWVVPCTLLVLLALFCVQRFGTDLLGRLFGPVMLAWFATIAVLGLIQVIETPEILAALDPAHGLRLLTRLTVPQAMSLMGAILLAVTGAEAIYADMGHFGRRPIHLAWYAAALQALLLSYLGQGAWLLRQPAVSAGKVSPFFAIVPEGWGAAMVVLAVAASIIASQAVISGLFSLSRQAIQLGYLPRLQVVQTSRSERGQIYVPRVNLVLAGGCMALALLFGSSSGLASSYGFAVAATMFMTSIAFTLVIVQVWRWSLWKILAFGLLALPLDVLFLCATIGKLESSYYLSLLVIGAIVWLLGSWLAGNRVLMDRAERLDMPVSLFAESLRERPDLKRWPGPAVYFQHLPFPPEEPMAPAALMLELSVNSTLASPAIVVTLSTTESAFVPEDARLVVQSHEPGLHAVTLRAGFAERFSVEPLIAHGIREGWWQDARDIRWFAGRERLRPRRKGILPFWMRGPFLWLHPQDRPLSDALQLPDDRFVEVAILIDV